MGKLILTELSLNGAYIIEPNKQYDSRGSFSRVFCQEELSNIFDGNIVQINHSITSKKGSVRGLHFQYPPSSEIKMVKCIKGSVFDVIVDIRENSTTFLQWFGTVLSAENMRMLYIPKGFAHGFQTLEEDIQMLYMHSEVYAPENEGALNVLDPRLAIEWPLPLGGLSRRDTHHPMITQDFQGIKA
jgi:dTDP-4-dehydrorhamnose 3,5-epimerase